MEITKGFTLIEVMVVVAIIGILAAIALPQNSSYTGRAQAIEGFRLANAIQAEVEMWFDEKGNFPDISAVSLAGPIGGSAGALEGKYIQNSSISVAAGTGVISIPFDEGSNAGTTLVLTPVVSNGKVSNWVCGGTIEVTNLPTSCN